MKKKLALGLLVLMVMLAGKVKAASVQTVGNEFIKIVVNDGVQDKGRFAVETTGGDPENPADDNQSLIFGRPVPWTSYTTVVVDGQPYVFGGINTKLAKRAGRKVLFGDVISQVQTDDAILTTCKFGAVTVIQKLTFSRNPATQVKDTALISYEMINNDDKPHTLGVRIMLDTKLGSNDAAPFRIGELACDSETAFEKNQLVEYWQTFDSLANPTIIAQGTLSQPSEGVSPPDHVFLVNWGTLADEPWEFDVVPGRSFQRAGETENDTALALYWDPVTVAPSGKRTVRTLYGLGGLSLTAGPLSLGLTSPAETYVSATDSFLIVGYVYNSGGFDSQNTVVTFDIPKGFKVVSGSLRQSLGTLKAGQTRQIPLRIAPNNPEAGKYTIGFTVTSTTLDPNSLKRPFEVVGPPTLKTVVTLPTTIGLETGYVTVNVSVLNPSNFTVSPVSITLEPPSGLELPFFEPKTKVIPVLQRGDFININWTLKTVAENSSANLVVTTKAPGAKADPVVTPLSVVAQQPAQRLEWFFEKGYWVGFWSVKVDKPQRVGPFRLEWRNASLESIVFLPGDALPVQQIRGAKTDSIQWSSSPLQPGKYRVAQWAFKPMDQQSTTVVLKDAESRVIAEWELNPLRQSVTENKVKE
ncbi:MAG: hypothetical protein AB7F28_01740 [Candidatus Margulisiibacteriota bacterium]